LATELLVFGYWFCGTSVDPGVRESELAIASFCVLPPTPSKLLIRLG
jgi:hypothetical protein